MEKSRNKSILSTTNDANYDLRAAVVLHCNVLNCSMSCKNFKAIESSVIKRFLELMPKPLTKCAQVSWQFLFVKSFLLETHFSYSKLTFLTRNSLFLLETSFSYSKLTFLTRNSLFLLETHFSYSETHFSYSKLTFPGNTIFGSFYLTVGIQNVATLATGKFSRS